MGWKIKKRAGGPLDSGRPYTRFDSNSPDITKRLNEFLNSLALLGSDKAGEGMSVSELDVQEINDIFASYIAHKLT